MLFGCCESGIGRRDILCSGGSAIFGSLVAALLGEAKPARAQTISGNVPEVDRATVRVVTDNYHFALSPSGKRMDAELFPCRAVDNIENLIRSFASSRI